VEVPSLGRLSPRAAQPGRLNGPAGGGGPGAAGGACGACGSDIFVGDIEYDVVVEGREMKLDATCYLILVEEAARLQPDES